MSWTETADNGRTIIVHNEHDDPVHDGPGMFLGLVWMLPIVGITLVIGYGLFCAGKAIYLWTIQ